MIVTPQIKTSDPVSDKHIKVFIDVYQALNKDNLFLLGDIYHCNITFIDPLHQVKGITALNDYFAHLYENVRAINFSIERFLIDGQEAALYWKMSYSHSKLNKGKPIVVSGHSHLRFRDGKVIYHHDYFDVGAMLYEHIPFFGAVVRSIKSRASQ